MSETNDPVDAPGGEQSARAVEIRQVAARIFREKGYEGTSIQDIADAVGILKGSLYYYIDSKEDLLYDVIRSAHEKGLADVRSWTDSDDAPSEVLRSAIRTHVTSNLARLEEVGVFFHDFRSLSPERRKDIVADRDLYDGLLRDVVVAGQQAGQFDPDADPKLVVMALLGMINWLYQWYSPNGPQTPEEIADTFADVLLRGLKAREDGVAT